jgi:NAD(P)-dependent dehydrogenase (short-subunit alcohol dehydrogenase family)
MARGNILITGASSGIGRACAIHFARLGYHVLAGARIVSDADSLKAEDPHHIEPVLLDVTRAESIADALAAAGDTPLAGLINNAGIAVNGPLELVSIELCRRQFEVNVIGLIAVTQAFIPLLRRGPGRIVNIGSIAGRSALPGSGPYNASKFAVEALTDSLRMELDPWEISVSVIEPGAIATPVWEKSLQGFDDLSRQVSPERYELYNGFMAKVRKFVTEAARNAIDVRAVVRAVEHAMTARKPKTRYLVGRDARLKVLLNLLPDRWRDRLILRDLNN